MNTSVILRGQSGLKRRPVSGSMSAVTTSEGTGKPSAKRDAGSDREKSAKMGTAACEPERFRPRLSSYPTQIAETKRGEKPTNHASRPSFVVPVFPARTPVIPPARAPPAVPRSTAPR